MCTYSRAAYICGGLARFCEEFSFTAETYRLLPFSIPILGPSSTVVAHNSLIVLLPTHIETYPLAASQPPPPLPLSIDILPYTAMTPRLYSNTVWLHPTGTRSVLKIDTETGEVTGISVDKPLYRGDSGDGGCQQRKQCKSPMRVTDKTTLFLYFHSDQLPFPLFLRSYSLSKSVSSLRSPSSPPLSKHSEYPH